MAALSTAAIHVGGTLTRPTFAVGSVGNIMYRELQFSLLTRKVRSGDARA
jgi:hypothetical protein